MPPDGVPLRVMHLVSSDTFAGIERHVLNLIREQQALGCAAELACPPSALRLRGDARASGIPVLPSPTCRPHAWPAAVVRSVLSRPPDVLHVHDGRSALIGGLTPLGLRTVFVRTQHFVQTATLDRSGWAKQGSLAAHRWLGRRLDGFIPVSQSVAAAARERRETGSSMVVVIPPAITLPDNASTAHAQHTREQRAWPIAVFAGRLEPERHLDVLLRAAPSVLRELPECHFVLAGSGSAEEELRLLAARLDIGEAITWTGWVADPYSVLADAHVYINTWPREAFGMAMAEAMAFALPVIAVDAGANREMVEEGVTGALVPVDDPSALADAIVRLLRDRPSAARMGENARRKAMSTYGARATAETTLALYRHLLEKAGS